MKVALFSFCSPNIVTDAQERVPPAWMVSHGVIQILFVTHVSASLRLPPQNQEFGILSHK